MPLMITKKELIEKISQKTGLKKAEVEKIIETAFDLISQSLAAGEAVRLVSFGAFLLRERKGRLGRNPKTGERLALAPSRHAAFVPGRGLKELIKARKK